MKPMISFGKEFNCLMKAFIAILATAAIGACAADLPVAPLGTYKPLERRFWAFQPRKDVTPPVLSDAAGKSWGKNSD